MAEQHLEEIVKRAEKQRNLTASSELEEFIDSSWIESFGEMSTDLWVGGAELVDDLFRLRMGIDLAPKSVLYGLAQDALQDARRSYLDLLKALAQKHLFSVVKPPLVIGEFNVGNVVQYGDVRGLLVKLGGGSADPQVQLMGGITTGATLQNYLAGSGVNTNQKIWLYGWEEQPRRTFNGHLQMDGLVFEHWDDNALIIAPQDRWLRRNYYAPGDHWGCACVVAPYFPNFGAPFEI